jgi:predicted acyl esterase
MFFQLIIEKDVAIELRDGMILRADVFRPNDSGSFPVIITLGPYPKDIHFKDWHPERTLGSPDLEGPYMHWETVNPEWWVPQGYVVVRADTRGSGKSPGRPRFLTMDEAQDFYDAIEWAGTQAWSNGKVAVMGISYFAQAAWKVAALNPPHLAAIVPWEGAFDNYRDVNRHGGIRSSNFTARWAKHTTGTKQEGEKSEQPVRPFPFPELCEGRVARNTPDPTHIKVPLLSVGNWGGVGLHLRGNIEGYLQAGSKHKFLRVHSGDHVLPFYSLEGRLEQKRFLEHWLKGVDTGILREPPIKLGIRYGSDNYVWRYEYEWPLARTHWTEYYLNAAKGTLSTEKARQKSVVSYSAEPDADNASATFSTPPFEHTTEVTGPMKLKLWVSSSVEDADLFAILHHMAANGEEVTYMGQMGHEISAAYGWLRVSHRKLDPLRSTPYRPFHIHDQLQKVRPGEVVPVEIEIWPASMVFQKGHRLVLEVGSKDDPKIIPFHHTDLEDRIQRGTNVIHGGDDYDSYLLLPVIPPRSTHSAA